MAVAVVTGVYALMVVPRPAPIEQSAAPYTPEIQSELPVLEQVAVTINDTVYIVEVAEKSADRKRGLSGRKDLGGVDGLLFIFPATGEHGIWMKEMHFSIDVIWLDEQGRVINVTEELTPESFPKIFYPEAPARYAIETNPGFAAGAGMTPGTQVELPSAYRLE